MLTSLWFAVVFLSATEQCATDSCLIQTHTIVVKAESLAVCERELAAYRGRKDVSQIEECEERKLK